MVEPREYWAFISYRHLDNKEPGREWAAWIAREIETYEVPADLVGTRNPRGEVIPERLYPVFRDEDELSASSDLSSPIYEALRRSKSLVVICSPRTISSRYVGNEIRYFKSLDRDHGILAMMIDGVPHADDERECFPVELKHPVDSDGELDTTRDVEPVAADFRLPDGSQGWHSITECRKHLDGESAVTRYRQRCELAKLKLIAGLLGLPLGQLVERDKAYQLELARKRARTVTMVAVALALLSIAAIVAGIFAAIKRKEAAAERDNALRAKAAAEQTREAAEGLVNEIIFDLRDKLETLGKIELLDDSASAAEAYFANLPSELVDEKSQRNRGVVHDTRARILEAGGDLEQALAQHREGLAIARHLANKAPDDLMLRQDVAISLKHVADILVAQNRPDEAEEALAEARAILDEAINKRLAGDKIEPLLDAIIEGAGDDGLPEMLHRHPQLVDLIGTSAVIAERQANTRLVSGHRDEAMDRYRFTRRVYRAMSVAAPGETQWIRNLASAHDKIGNTHLQAQELEAARPEFQSLTDIAKLQLDGNPTDAFWLDLYAGGLDRLASIDTLQGNTAKSLELSSEALDYWTQLADADPGNLERRRNLFVGFHKLGLAQSASGNTELADETFAKSLAIARELVAADPSNATWRLDLAFSLDRLANRLGSEGKRREALDIAGEALTHHRRLAREAPGNLQVRRNLLITLKGIALNHWALEDREAAVEVYEEASQIARSIVDDLAEPTVQSHTDLAQTFLYLAQLAEERSRRDDALRHYRSLLALAREAGALGLTTKAEADQTEKTLEAKIASLEQG